MSEGAEFSFDESEDGAARLVLTGPWLVSTVGKVDKELRELEGPVAALDLSHVSEIDTVGAWLACTLAGRLGADITGANAAASLLGSI